MNMNDDYIRELIDQIEDVDLAEEILSAVRHAIRSAELGRAVERAEANLDEACAWAQEDMTGQDGEDYCDACARDLIAARDDKLRHDDPDRYSEMKAMGLLR